MSKQSKGAFYGLTSGFLWGVNGILVGAIMASSLLTSRIEGEASISLVLAAINDSLIFLGLFLYHLARKKGKELLKFVFSKNGCLIALGAICGGPLSMTAYLYSIHKAGPVYTLVMSANYPAIGAILASFLLKEKMSLSAKKGLFLSTLGSIIVGLSTVSSEGLSFLPLWAVGISLLPAMGWALEGVIVTLTTKNDEKEQDSLLILNHRQLSSSLVYLLLLLPLFNALPLFNFVATSSLMSQLTFMAALGGISYCCWYRGMHLLGVGKGMALNMTYALWIVLFDYKTFSWPLLVGAFMVVLGASYIIIPKDEFTFSLNAN